MAGRWQQAVLPPATATRVRIPEKRTQSWSAFPRHRPPLWHTGRRKISHRFCSPSDTTTLISRKQRLRSRYQPAEPLAASRDLTGNPTTRFLSRVSAAQSETDGGFGVWKGQNKG